MPKSFNRRDFIKKTVCAVSAFAAGESILASALSANAKEFSQMRPNILLLFADQHNADALGCAGHPLVKTPHIDALARQGVRFTRTYCQDGICVPSRVSLMTGLYPRVTGCLDNSDENMLNDQQDFRPLQQVLQSAGYFTVFAGKLHMGRRRLIQGWDRSATVLPLKAEPLQESYFDWIKAQGLETAFLRDWEGTLKSDLGAHISDLPDEMRDATYTTARARGYIQEAARLNKPFFCWASFHGPHQPYTPTKKWADMYPWEKMPLPETLNEPIENLPPDLQNWRKNTNKPWNLATAAQNPDLYRHYIANYFAQISEVDHEVGQMLDCLDKIGQRENTIIIYASDHGDFMGRHGMVEKCALGHNVYEDTLRVPLIISWPGHFKQNVTCNSLTELVDIYPTLAEAVKLERPANALPLSGRSLFPSLVEGKPTERRYAFSENWSQATVIGERYKLGVWIDPGQGNHHKDWRGKTRDQLYDRQSDPQEIHNLCGKQEVADVEKELRDALAAWQRTVPDEGRRAIGEALVNKPKPAAGKHAKRR